MLKLAVMVLGFSLLPALAFAKDATVTLKVEGWHCEGCSSATEASLKKVPGVKSVKTDLAKKEAVVVFDDEKATRADLEKAVQASGYKVVP